MRQTVVAPLWTTVGWLVVAAALVPPRESPAETVAWYRFEEGVGKESMAGVGAVRDSSGNRLHGTCASTGGAIFTQAIAPFGDGALGVVGRDGWVFVPDSPKLALTGSLTVEAFVHIRRFQTDGVANFIVFRGDNRSGMDAYWLALDPWRETLHFGLEGQGGAPGDPPARVSTRFRRYLGETVHVAGVLDDEAGVLRLYVNGRLKDSQETRVRPRAELHPLYQPGLGIGGFFAGPAPASFCVDGIVDEVRISDTALGPDELLCAREEDPED